MGKAKEKGVHRREQGKGSMLCGFASTALSKNGQIRPAVRVAPADRSLCREFRVFRDLSRHSIGKLHGEEASQQLASVR